MGNKKPTIDPKTLGGTGIMIAKPATNPEEAYKYPLELCVRTVCALPGKKRLEVCVRDMGDKRGDYPVVTLDHPEVEPVYEKWLNDQLQTDNYLDTPWMTIEGSPCIVRLTQIPNPQ